MNTLKIRRAIMLLPAGLIVIISAAFIFARPKTQQNTTQQSFPSLRPDDLSGFASAEPGREFDFPADHGPHPAYQTEWWYFTGNLETASGDRFGYQLTFFRRSLVPPTDFEERESRWATNEVYLAHFTITDVERNSFDRFERFSRGGDTGMAGASSEPFEIWLEDWRVVTEGDDTYSLHATQNGLALDLLLIDSKGPVLQGDDGYSPKSPNSDDASYYYSLTRLASTGTITTDHGLYEVSGSSWMDHEFSTGALAEGQVGWDWFGLQLDNNYEVMAFQLRDKDGPLNDTFTFVLVHPDGSVQKSNSFSIRVLDTWTSSETGATYPAGWVLSNPDLDIELSIMPLISDQELVVSYTYWEGAVAIEGQLGTETVTGSGYVELTGYAESMAGQF